MRPLALLLLALAACSPLEPPIVECTALTDTTDLNGPYAVEARVTARRSIDRVELVWHNAAVSPGQAQRTRMDLDERSGIWRGAIPGLGRGAVIAYHVEATDDSGDLGFGPPGAAVGTRCGDEFCFSVLPVP